MVSDDRLTDCWIVSMNWLLQGSAHLRTAGGYHQG